MNREQENKEIEKLTDRLYQMLNEIQDEQVVPISDKAFIADCLALKLIAAGYLSQNVLKTTRGIK